MCIEIFSKVLHVHSDSYSKEELMCKTSLEYNGNNLMIKISSLSSHKKAVEHLVLQSSVFS